MPRPPVSEEDRRSVWIKYRASPAAREELTARCRAAGLSLSAFHRTLALEGAIIQREAIADQELVRQLAAIGNNLNQLARTANISGEVDSPTAERLHDSLEALDGLIARIIG